jgi:hypothetical protein
MQEKLNWQLARFNKESGQFETESGVFLATRFLEALKFHPPGVAPVKDESGWYHIDALGNPLYSQRYARCFGFYEGSAAVQTSEGWTHVNLSGEELPNVFEWVGNFQGGHCVVRNDAGEYYHIDNSGKPVYSERYRYAGDYRDGMACVASDKGWTHIDGEGKPTHGRHFNGLNVYHKGYALAMDDSGWFHVYQNGAAIYAHRFSSLEPFYNGCALALKYNGEWVVVDQDSRIVTAIGKLDSISDNSFRITTKATLHWSGPHSLSEAMDFQDETHYGLYLITGRHPAFGMEMPLYLGKAAEQKLGTRIAQHEGWTRHESKDIKVYVGRLISTEWDGNNRSAFEGDKSVPSAWSSLIDRAERLLIFSCSFPYNSSSVKWMDFQSDELTVMNLGERHMLPMVVSTLYWKEYYELNGDGENAKPESRYWVWKGE